MVDPAETTYVLNPGGGNSHTEVTEVIVVPFRGKNSWFGTPRVLKPKITIVRVMAVPFRVLSRKI